LMGQKVNPKSLRLKKRLNWNILFNTHNFKSYANLTFTNQNVFFLIQKLFNKFHYFTNNLVVWKTSKNIRLFSKVIEEQKSYNNPHIELSTFSRFYFLKNQRKILTSLLFNQQNFFFCFLKFIIKKKKKKI